MDTYQYTTFARSRVKDLRKHMTPYERHLWYDYLKSCPRKFQRQKAIGPYIVDFVCYAARLIIELDGEQHGEEDAYLHDEARTHYMEQHGFRVLRFRNHDVNTHFEGVCQTIERALEDKNIQGRMSSDGA